jgi:hypothetical protein
MKTFKVLVTAHRLVIIEAENAEEAEQTASEECTDFDWVTDGWKAEQELTPEGVDKAIKQGVKLLEDW